MQRPVQLSLFECMKKQEFIFKADLSITEMMTDEFYYHTF